MSSPGCFQAYETGGWITELRKCLCLHRIACILDMRYHGSDCCRMSESGKEMSLNKDLEILLIGVAIWTKGIYPGFFPLGTSKNSINSNKQTKHKPHKPVAETQVPR